MLPSLDSQEMELAKLDCLGLKCVGQFVLQVNKVSLSLCQALSGSLQVLSNHNNNWSRRLARGDKGTSVCRWRERLKETLLSCALHLNHCHAVTLRNTEPYCVVYVCMSECLNNLQVHNLLRMWLSVWVCAHRDSTHVIIHYCTPVVFFPPHSPLCRLYPWMRSLFGFSSSFPLCTLTPVLLSVSWPGHMAVFFFFTLASQRK